MRQVLFYIPLQSWFGILTDIPIYGYGAMLFVAFVCCIWLATRLGRREGIPSHVPQDLALWLFVSGIIGARITFMIQFRDKFYAPLSNPLGWLGQFVQLWDGGLVFYGSAIGGVIGYFIYYLMTLRKLHVSSWTMADIVAPCGAVGLCLGRVGCLLNGCCYGEVAGASCPAVHFPLSTAPMYTMVERGYQTAAGFTYDGSRRVVAVEPGSAAAEADLRTGDVVLEVDGNQVTAAFEMAKHLGPQQPRGNTDLDLVVQRGDDRVVLPTFRPITLGLHPTQIYETISMGLLVFLLLSYYPFKRHPGSVMVFFMLGYGVHRFLNEMLRTDNDPVAFGMTLSQNISIIVIIAGALLGLVVWRNGPSLPAPTPLAASELGATNVPEGDTR